MEYSLPSLIISKELIERIQFSVSSRNAESKLGECAVHVFAAPYMDNAHDIKWQYVSSGVTCLLRNRELTANGRKYMWSMSLCLYNASYGVLVWKAKLLPNSDYTAVADNFHVFALGEVNVLVGLMFSSKDRACEIHTTYTKWHQERMRDDGKKGALGAQQPGTPEMRFRKDMISKPCNFQHIQGTQAIDECMDIEKIKADIIAAFFGMGTKAGRSEADGGTPQKSRKKKKEPPKQKLVFKEIELPLATSNNNTSLPNTTSPASPLSPGVMPAAYTTVPHMVHQDSQQQALPPAAPPSGVTPDQYNPALGNSYPDRSVVPPQAVGVNPLEQQHSSTSLHGYSNPEPNGYPVAPYDDQQGGRTSQARPDSQKDTAEVPNYQNPASPAFQEYGTSSQDSYSYNIAPPRLEMNLEKEFAESAIFKSSIMTS